MSRKQQERERLLREGEGTSKGELGDNHKRGRGKGTIVDRARDHREAVGNSARYVLGPGTPESPSAPRLYPLQAGGQVGLFVFKHHLLLSNNENKRNQNSTGRCSSVAVGNLPHV